MYYSWSIYIHLPSSLAYRSKEMFVGNYTGRVTLFAMGDNWAYKRG